MTRDKIIDLIMRMRNNTVANGCTPGEAAKFAAKIAELVEKYQIEEAEIPANSTGGVPDEIEVCEHKFRTGKRVFNPGTTQVFNALAEGMCCKCILLHEWSPTLHQMEAVYGITGEVLDATLVCQVAASVVPALRVMAALEAGEHGQEGGALVRWTNQYLTGAGSEIRRRLEGERKARSDAKIAASPNALVLVTGDSLATVKREAALEAFNKKYPVLRTTHSRSQYDPRAYERGVEAGKRVGLRATIE